MSKLSTVIKNMESLKGLPEEMPLPLPWAMKDLLERLKYCALIDNLAWHQHMLSWIEQADCHALGQLCGNVINSLLPAITKTKLLRDVVEGNKQLPCGTSNRLILCWALVDIQKAFKAFQIMHTDPALAQYHIREMALRYLERVYELMLLLSQLLYPLGSDLFWFTASWQYLKETRLKEFEFDGPNDYKRVADPTLAGVLVDSAAVEDCYLPARMEPFFPP
jgi:hypothetical protein